ncbi:MAG: hypothetical protein KDD40_02445, partial [Bdellovibrionales bacterium]|nr:hypothetical protein [Bdellovibrionales bacterium]
MKKAIMITLLSVVFMVSLSACSSNWKEGSSGITEEELFEELDSMSAFSTASNGAGSGLYNELKDKPDTKRYFARSGDNSNGGLGPAYSVVSFGDFSPFGVHKEISIYDLESAKVALLDGFDSQDQRRFVLAVNYQTKDGDSVTYYAEDAGFEFGKTKLQIQVNQGDRT